MTNPGHPPSLVDNLDARIRERVETGLLGAQEAVGLLQSLDHPLMSMTAGAVALRSAFIAPLDESQAWRKLATDTYQQAVNQGSVHSVLAHGHLGQMQSYVQTKSLDERIIPGTRVRQKSILETARQVRDFVSTQPSLHGQIGKDLFIMSILLPMQYFALEEMPNENWFPMLADCGAMELDRPSCDIVTFTTDKLDPTYKIKVTPEDPSRRSVSQDTSNGVIGLGAKTTLQLSEDERVTSMTVVRELRKVFSPTCSVEAKEIAHSNLLTRGEQIITILG